MNLSSEVRYLIMCKVKLTESGKSFPLGQFKINDFNMPFPLNRNSRGGGTMLFDWKIYWQDSEKPLIEAFCMETNLIKKKVGDKLLL